MIEKLKVWFKNSLIFHQQIMRKYLEKRGWVVFYLETEFRKCKDSNCFLNLYEAERKRVKKGKV